VNARTTVVARTRSTLPWFTSEADKSDRRPTRTPNSQAQQSTAAVSQRQTAFLTNQLPELTPPQNCS